LPQPAMQADMAITAMILTMLMGAHLSKPRATTREARGPFHGMNYADQPLLRSTKQAPPARIIFAHSPFALSRVSAPIRT
jgi:hypothetical protein